ncbi:MAG: 5-formyltetrahydrofolate cyclo-ligase [Pseudomonadota bacterium]
MTDAPTRDIADQKKQLRKRILKVRDELVPTYRIEASLTAGENLTQWLSFNPGTVVSGFWPIRSEIDPRPALSKLRQLGATLCLPVVVGPSEIVFRELVRGAPMVETGFGTHGPDEPATVLEPNILIIPLSAFDRSGGRLGYGAGFYDRAISRMWSVGKSPRLIGFAFADQQVDEVPLEEHDQLLEAIVTEKEVIQPATRRTRS